MSDQNADLVTPVTPAPLAPEVVAPEAQKDAPAPEVVAAEAQPAEPTEPPAPRKRQYIPCTGKQISTFLRAVELGMKDAHYASEGEVNEFTSSKGA